MYSKFEALLKQSGTSAYKVSKETGVSQSTLSDWKRGISKPKEDKIRKIAEYFNKPISYFYDDEEPHIETEKPADVGELSEAKQELIDFVISLQEDAADSMLRMMKAYYEEWQRNQR